MNALPPRITTSKPAFIKNSFKLCSSPLLCLGNVARVHTLAGTHCQVGPRLLSSAVPARLHQKACLYVLVAALPENRVDNFLRRDRSSRPQSDTTRAPRVGARATSCRATHRRLKIHFVR